MQNQLSNKAQQIAEVRKLQSLPAEVYSFVVQVTGEKFTDHHGGGDNEGQYPDRARLIENTGNSWAFPGCFDTHSMDHAKASRYGFSFKDSQSIIYASGIGYYSTHGGHVLFINETGNLFLAPVRPFICEELDKAGYRGGHEIGPANFSMGWIVLSNADKADRMAYIEELSNIEMKFTEYDELPFVETTTSYRALEEENAKLRAEIEHLKAQKRFHAA
ncbi:hypothetical protein FWH13_02395 [Candidatus Saccharibacteria bacterium]|nr:hypothetical protein [Candidatus Saccharibacteria bacterium]